MKKICKKCGKEFSIGQKDIVTCKDCRGVYGRKDKGLNDILESITNKKHKETIIKWVEERKANGFTLKSTVGNLYTIRKISKLNNKAFEDWTKEDINKVLSGLKGIHYRRFLKQFFKSIGQSEKVIGISLKKTVDDVKKQRRKIFLTEEQMAEILKRCDNPQDRFMFELFADIPLRPKDLENLKIKDVHIDNFGVVLDFHSKTEQGKRELLLKNSRVAFLKFWENHPFKDEKDKPLFYSVSNKDYGNPIKWTAMDGRFRKIVKRTKLSQDIKDNLTLYVWRRSITTILLSDPDYSPSEVQKMGGWASIKMFDTYGKIRSGVLNKKRMVKQAVENNDKATIQELIKKADNDSQLAKILKHFGLLKGNFKDVLGTKLCSFCNKENLSNADFCSNPKCSKPLTQKGFEQMEHRRMEAEHLTPDMKMIVGSFIRLIENTKMIDPKNKELEHIKKYIHYPKPPIKKDKTGNWEEVW